MTSDYVRRSDDRLNWNVEIGVHTRLEYIVFALLLGKIYANTLKTRVECSHPLKQQSNLTYDDSLGIQFNNKNVMILFAGQKPTNKKSPVKFNLVRGV